MFLWGGELKRKKKKPDCDQSSDKSNSFGSSSAYTCYTDTDITERSHTEKTIDLEKIHRCPYS